MVIFTPCFVDTDETLSVQDAFFNRLGLRAIANWLQQTYNIEIEWRYAVNVNETEFVLTPDFLRSAYDVSAEISYHAYGVPFAYVLNSSNQEIEPNMISEITPIKAFDLMHGRTDEEIYFIRLNFFDPDILAEDHDLHSSNWMNTLPI
jgi:hypothetical protein